MKLCERRLTAHALGTLVCLVALAGCSDDDAPPPINTPTPDGGASSTTTAHADAAPRSDVSDGAAPAPSPGVDASVATSLPDAGGETQSTSRDGGANLDADVEPTTAPSASTSRGESSAPSSEGTITGSSEVSGVVDTRPAPSTETASAPDSSAEVDAASPLEPDATLVQTSEDFAGSEPGGGADGIDDAKVSITLDGPIESLLIASADAAWQVTSAAYWWSQPGNSIPPSAPVLGGYTTHWNLYVEADGYPQMTDRNMAPLGAGAHDLTIYASWAAFSQPAYFVALAFDAEGNIVSTHRLAY